jgi:hypothetical protein
LVLNCTFVRSEILVPFGSVVRTKIDAVVADPLDHYASSGSSTSAL